jgi:hypothetical protein
MNTIIKRFCQAGKETVITDEHSPPSENFNF